MIGRDVHHRTLGILGMGRIGQAVARRAAGFSMRILYHDPVRISPELERELNAEFVTKERVLRESDFVSIHVPLSAETRHAIGEAELIERTPRLVKICSKEFVPKLVERALSGLKLSHLPVPPPALSPNIEFQYFAIDKAGPCWEHMVKTRDLAVYIPGELPDPEIELSVILQS